MPLKSNFLKRFPFSKFSQLLTVYSCVLSSFKPPQSRNLAFHRAFSNWFKPSMIQWHWRTSVHKHSALKAAPTHTEDTEAVITMAPRQALYPYGSAMSSVDTALWANKITLMNIGRLVYSSSQGTLGVTHRCRGLETLKSSVMRSLDIHCHQTTGASMENSPRQIQRAPAFYINVWRDVE